MRLMLTFIASIAAIAASLLPSGSCGIRAATEQTQDVHVSFITCPDALYYRTSPRATVLPALTASNSETPITLTAQPGGFYSGVVNMPPGHYSLSVRDGFCQGNERFTVLPGRDRDLGLVLRENHRSTYDFQSSLVGTLPLGVRRAFLTAPNGGDIPLQLDSGAYYGEGLYAANYTLNLELQQDGLVCRLPVKVAYGENRRDVSSEDIIYSVGYYIRIHGQPERFQLLFSRNQIR